MATLVLNAAAAWATDGAYWGWQIAAHAAATYAGGQIDQQIFGSAIQGPRLQSLVVQTSTLGNAINMVKGEVRVGGNMIWSTPYFENANTSGKGGGGGSVTTYTYTQTMAVGVCQGPVIGVRRIWATGRLVYDAGDNLTPPIWAASTTYAIGNYTYNVGNLYKCVKAGTSSTSGPTVTGNTSSSVVTISIASPAVVTWPAHGLTAGALVTFGTADTLPTGMLAGVTYWAVNVTTNTFGIAATYGGTAINTTGSQSGTQSCTAQTDIFDGSVAWEYVGTYTEDQAGVVVSNNAPTQSTWFTFYQGNETQLPNSIISAYMQTQPNTYYFAPGPLPAPVAQVQVGAGVIELVSGALVYQPLQVTGDIPACSIDGPTSGPSANYHMIARVVVNATTGAVAVVTGPQTQGDGITIPAVPSGYCPVCYVRLEYTTPPIPQQITAVTDERIQNWAKNIAYAGTIDVSGFYKYVFSNGLMFGLTSGGTSGSTELGTLTDNLGNSPPLPGNTVQDGSCTWTCIEVTAGTIPPLPTPAYRGLSYVVFNNYSLTATGNTTPNWEFQVVEGTANCGDLVTWICGQAGLSPTQLDVTTIEPIAFDGYVMNTQSSARAMIEPIASSYFFDAVESDGLIKFVKRGGSLAMTIPEADLAAHDNGSKMPDQLAISRIQDLELPLLLTVQYPDENDSYLPGSKYHRMQGTESRLSTTVQLPLALTDSEAQGIVDKMINVIWNERDTFDFVTSRKYCYLEPTDIIAVEKDQDVYEVRLQEKNDSGGLITWKACAEDVGLYSNVLNNLLDNIKPPAAWNNPPGNVVTPLIIDAPSVATTSGYELWIAAGSANVNWGGCSIFVSTDNSTFNQIGTLHGTSNYGTGTVASSPDPDTSDTLVVNMSSTGGSMDSVSQSDADNLLTLSYIGGEFISYETAVLVGQDEYDATYLRRGVYGSPISSHANAPFALIDKHVFKYPYSPSMAGQTLYFKFPSFNVKGGAGENIGSIATYSHTIAGPSGFPASVAGFSAVVNPDFSVLLTWTGNTESNIKDYGICVGATWGTSPVWAAGTSYLVPPATGLNIVTYSVKARNDALSVSVSSAQLTVSTQAAYNTASATSAAALVAPTLTATGEMFSVALSWTFSGGTNVVDTEIWWNSIDDRTSASLIVPVTYPTNNYAHVALSPGQNCYYWCRVKDTYGNESAWYPTSATAGVYAAPSTDPSALLTQLTNSIGVRQLTSQLAEPIITTPGALVSQAQASIQDSLDSFTLANTVNYLSTITNAVISVDPTTGVISLLATANVSTDVQNQLNTVQVLANATAGTVTTLSGTVATQGGNLSVAQGQITVLQGQMSNTASTVYVNNAVAQVAGPLTDTAANAYTALAQAEIQDALDAFTNGTSLTSLTANVATVSNQVTTVANATQSLATSQGALVAAFVGQNATTAAGFLTEQTARAAADTALATSTSVLFSQVNDPSTGLPATAAVLATTTTTASNAASGVTALNATYTLKAQAGNGAFAAFQLGASTSGTGGSVIFECDNFTICKPNGSGSSATPITAFEIGTVGGVTAIGMNGNLIVDGSISAQAINGTGLTLTTGTTPAISGSTMTGSGAVINGAGHFAFGNTTNNIVFDGTNVYITGNISATSVTASRGLIAYDSTGMIEMFDTSGTGSFSDVIAFGESVGLYSQANSHYSMPGQANFPGSSLSSTLDVNSYLVTGRYARTLVLSSGMPCAGRVRAYAVVSTSSGGWEGDVSQYDIAWQLNAAGTLTQTPVVSINGCGSFALVFSASTVYLQFTSAAGEASPPPVFGIRWIFDYMYF